ncbi:MAG TPA: CPBP family intramembrane glutamic endopeptidase [Coriobacteriia bacterium]|jgi:hypothetical protein
MLWAATPIVLGVMALLFGTLPYLIGRKRGYLAAFVAYWLGFGLAYPLLLVGPQRLLAMLRAAPLPGGLLGVGIALLLLGPPLGAGVICFRPRLGELTPAVLAVSALLALVNGTAEELLWRAAPVAAFPHQPLLAVVVPALGFGAWHLAPQIVLPARGRGGAAAFTAAAVVLGLCYGTVVYVTGSATLAIASHVLTDFLGLGGFAYLTTRSGKPPELER